MVKSFLTSGPDSVSSSRSTCMHPEMSSGQGGMGGPDNAFLKDFTNIFHRGPYRPPSRRNSSRRGSVPEFLRKPIATCDFPVGGGGADPLSGSAHALGLI